MAAQAEEIVVAPPPGEPFEEPIAASAEIEEPIAAAGEPTVVPGFATPEPEVVLAEEAPIEPPAEPLVEPPVEAQEPEPQLLIPPGPKRDLRDTFGRGPIVRPTPSREPAPETLAARRSQLDILGIEDPGEGSVPVGERDALPYRSSGAGSAPHSAAVAAIWDASSRYLESGAQRAALAACGSCGLTVSSTARFCRRCGAPQTLSA
jgi:hypothetical protein